MVGDFWKVEKVRRESSTQSRVFKSGDRWQEGTMVVKLVVAATHITMTLEEEGDVCLAAPYT